MEFRVLVRMSSLKVLLVLISVWIVNAQIYDNEDVANYPLPKFWTNTGLCPRIVGRHESVRLDLLSDTMLMNLRLIAALPIGSITHVRIHWMLELMRFAQFSQAGIPEYDFSGLDQFLDRLIALKLKPVLEFMGNFSNLFLKNPPRNAFLWENLVYQGAKRYSGRFGWSNYKQWRHETWNEPDLRVYNILNFTIEDYLNYVKALKNGLQRISLEHKEEQSLSLRGPAGLFKQPRKHPLCWGLLDYCERQLIGSEPVDSCPIDVLTYHRKGSGENVTELISKSKALWHQICEKYPKLSQLLPISNDEADPISGWSRSRAFHSDMRYAVALVRITFEHWNVLMTHEKSFRPLKLDSISHDNAFISYHPFEFTQRTLLAHFRFNDSQPPYSQFIHKPVYGVLGLMSRLGARATKLFTLSKGSSYHIQMINTTSTFEQDNTTRPLRGSDAILYFNWLLWSSTTIPNEKNLKFLPKPVMNRIELVQEYYWFYIIEVMDQNTTNPVKIWQQYNKPFYPNATIRSEMRNHQSPRLLASGPTKDGTAVNMNFGELPAPWLVSIRMCGSLSPSINTGKPLNLLASFITRNEVLLTWEEVNQCYSSCIKTYEVFYYKSDSVVAKWQLISRTHLPFPSFHYAPDKENSVNGFYRVRGIDVFNNFGQFSDEYEYIEI